MLSAIDRNRCPPSNGMPVRHHRNTHPVQSIYPQQSRYLAVANKQLEIMLRIACEFGFTPASRSRIFLFTQKNAMLLDAAAESDDDSLW
jgi:phage terminase small subunit